MIEEHGLPCEVCGVPPGAGDQWILLNRFGVGTGSVRRLTERLNDELDYLWEIHPGGDTHDELATGPVLHWPVCARDWIDAYIAETDIWARQERITP